LPIPSSFKIAFQVLGAFAGVKADTSIKIAGNKQVAAFFITE
jgi:hypothetical protein